MKSLIIGSGEVGMALNEVLKQAHDSHLVDINPPPLEGVEVLNLCFPYSPDFVKEARKYIQSYRPKFVINHSTVPIGTTRQLGDLAVHSPVNGRHPDLINSLRAFVKFIGATNAFASYEAARFLQLAGMNTMIFSSPETTELAKILCTTRFGWDIAFMKEAARICKEYKLPFHEVYTEWTWHYNQGYKNLNHLEFTRPALFPMSGGIGGHCIMPNCDLLEDFLTELVKGRNQLYQKEELNEFIRKGNDYLPAPPVGDSGLRHRGELQDSQPRLDRPRRGHRKQRKNSVLRLSAQRSGD